MDPNACLVFVSAFGLSGFAGLASLLRSGSKLDVTTICTHFLNSGMLGLGISLLWYTKYKENVYFLVGVCLVSGLGGMTMVDFVVTGLRKGTFNITIGTDDEHKT